MHDFITNPTFDSHDLEVYQYGTEKCSPGHSYGPALRDHYLIHYIVQGKGKFQVGEKTYYLGKGQGFLICPDILTFYQADFDDPWHYYWIGFQGLKANHYLKAANLSMDAPIFTYDKDNRLLNCLQQLLLSNQFPNSKEIYQIGQLCMFLSLLIENSPKPAATLHKKNQQEQYIKDSVNYIRMNYSRKISISTLAQYIGLDRSYLCFLFKKYLNMSPQNFLIKFRMEKACELMKNHELSIGDIARSVGYEDPLLFSKIFKKIYNTSPKEYRKTLMGD